MPALLFFCSWALSLQAQKNVDGIFLNFGILGSKASRPTMEKYLDVVSDTLNLNPGLKATNSFGVNIGVLFHTGKTEFDLGGFVAKGGYHTSMEGLDPRPYARCTDIEMHLGFNYLPVDWFIFGAHFMANVEQDNTLKSFNSAAITSPDSDLDLNIFKGYSVGIKAIAGLNIPVSKEGYSYLRITPFYQLGLTKYNYYKLFDNSLTSYSGDKKSRISQAGFMFGLVIPIKVSD